MKLISAVRNRYNKHFLALKGWRTHRKIVVFESDDWGSIRMPDKRVYKLFLDAGLKVNNSHYCRNDSIATCRDLEMLFEVLMKHRDFQGNYPVITANTIMGNPDFEKIKASNFQHYFFEPFTETLKRYPDSDFKLWQQGIDSNVFFPQMHGREHLNVARWLNYLQKNSSEHHFAFRHQTFALSQKASLTGSKSIFQALNADNQVDLLQHENILREGFRLFEKVFGFKSETFIAPNYIWHPLHEQFLSRLEVKYLQGNFLQLIPQLDATIKGKVHYCGEKNKYNQRYLIRNCLFEPASKKNHNWVRGCMNEISNSFCLKKPAIITSHRVNYVGRLNPANRDANLKLLDQLLFQIKRKWPGVEFMNSSQLGHLMDQTGR